jgi:hypothetical protein
MFLFYRDLEESVVNQGYKDQRDILVMRELLDCLENKDHQ